MESVEERRERYARALESAEADYHDFDGRESALTCTEWMAQQVMRLVDAERAQTIREISAFLHQEDRIVWDRDVWVALNTERLRPRVRLYEWLNAQADKIDAAAPGWTPWGHAQRSTQFVEWNPATTLTSVDPEPEAIKVCMEHRPPRTDGTCPRCGLNIAEPCPGDPRMCTRNQCCCGDS